MCSSHEELLARVHHVGDVKGCDCLIIWMDRKSGLDEGRNRPEQEGQQKHLSEDWPLAFLSPVRITLIYVHDNLD